MQFLSHSRRLFLRTGGRIRGLFAAAKIALEERRILHDLGYPQPPTTILRDNEFAVGLAQRTLTPKLSKSIDMRFHWLQDRVRRQHFCVQHVPGVLNLADYFTKSLHPYKHTQFAPYIASDSATGLPSYYCLYMIFATVCFYSFNS